MKEKHKKQQSKQANKKRQKRARGNRNFSDGGRAK